MKLFHLILRMQRPVTPKFRDLIDQALQWLAWFRQMEIQEEKKMLGRIKNLEQQLQAGRENYELMCKGFTSTLEVKNAELAQMRTELEQTKAELNGLKIKVLSGDGQQLFVSSVEYDMAADQQHGTSNRRMEAMILDLQAKNRLLGQAVALKDDQLQKMEKEKRQLTMDFFEEKLAKERATFAFIENKGIMDSMQGESADLKDKVKEAQELIAALQHDNTRLDGALQIASQEALRLQGAQQQVELLQTERIKLHDELQKIVKDLQRVKQIASEAPGCQHVHLCDQMGYWHAVLNGTMFATVEEAVEACMSRIKTKQPCSGCVEQSKALLESLLTLGITVRKERANQWMPPSYDHYGWDPKEQEAIDVHPSQHQEAADEESDDSNGVQEKFKALHESLVGLRHEIALMKSGVSDDYE